MGIVIKQSIWSSVIVYAGVIIGYINSLILLPYFLDVDSIGLIRLIQSNGMILVPLVIVGMNGSYTKFYPEFSKDAHFRNQVLSFQLVLVTAAMLFVIGLIYLFKGAVEGAFDHTPGEYSDYLFISVMILIGQGYFHYLIYLLFSEKNATFPSFLNEVLLRILTIIALLLFAAGTLTFNQFIGMIGVSYLVALLILVLFIRVRLGVQFNWQFYQLETIWIKKLMKFGAYTLLIATCSSVLMNISYPITASILGMEANGILTISIFIGTIIEMPKRVVVQVVAPYISKDFADNNLKSINATYQRSSINLAIIGVLLGIGIATNIKDLYLLIPQGETFQSGLILVFLVVLSKIISMMFSVSAEILTYSKYYKLNLIYVVTSALLMIGLNLLFVPLYGITGAGLAILLTGIYNHGSRYLTLRTKFGFSPFTPKLWLLFGIGTVIFLAAWFIPTPFHPLINILIRSVITAIFFISSVYGMKISYEVNTLIDKSIEKGISLFK